jgi:hypothetical protein
MDNNQQPPDDGNKRKPVVKRKSEDLELKKQLLLSPEAFLTERASDASLDKLSLKIKLISGREFTLAEYIAEEMTAYESKFFKDWFYKIADIYGVNRTVMDVYVKPDFVRRFIIQFVYGRFPYLLLRTLRSRNRRKKEKKGKLYHHLKKDASEKLDVIIAQVYEILNISNSPTDFKEKYCKKYNLFFQVELAM